LETRSIVRQSSSREWELGSIGALETVASGSIEALGCVALKHWRLGASGSIGMCSLSESIGDVLSVSYNMGARPGKYNATQQGCSHKK